MPYRSNSSSIYQFISVANGQGTAVSPETSQRREILPPVPTLTSQQTCSPMQVIGNIDCDTASTGPVRAGAIRMGCPESSSCMRESTSGQAFCCWESSAMVTCKSFTKTCP